MKVALDIYPELDLTVSLIASPDDAISFPYFAQYLPHNITVNMLVNHIDSETINESYNLIKTIKDDKQREINIYEGFFKSLDFGKFRYIVDSLASTKWILS